MKPWTEITHYAGFDWARDHHDVVIVDRQGQIVADFRIEHSLAGWQAFRDQVKSYPALAVAIETNQGTAVDQLLSLASTIYPVNPLSAKSYRERKAPSGHKTDRLDAWSLAEALRQDGQQWKALQPMDPLTQQLQLLCRDEIGLIEQRTALINQLQQALVEYYPAALEAYHSANKLLFLTADRPAHLRRTGANQTTLQVGLLAPIETVDIASVINVSEMLRGGPAHLNIQFDEPLLGDDRSDWLAGLTPKTLELELSNTQELFSPARRGLLIVGHDRAGFDPLAISLFADSLGWPLIAEDPLSFPEAIAHASLLLTDPEMRATLRPDQIVVVGRTTLSRSINTFIKECEEVVVIDPRTLTVDTDRSASKVFANFPDGYCEKDKAHR